MDPNQETQVTAPEMVQTPQPSTPSESAPILPQSPSSARAWPLISFVCLLVGIGIGFFVHKVLPAPDSQITLTPTAAVNTGPVANPSECVIYGIDEENDNDSQVVTIDPKTKIITPLGSLQKGLQLENIAIHPQTKLLYVNSSNKGDIYTVDAKTGEYAPTGQAHSGEITGFAIRPTDASFWGWAKEVGLVQIHTDKNEDEVLLESLKRGSALTWNPQGTLLYGTYKDDSQLFAYDPDKKSSEIVAFDIPDATRGLSYLSGTQILGANSEEDGVLHLYVFDLATKLVTKESSIETPYFNTRGVAWKTSCGEPL